MDNCLSKMRFICVWNIAQSECYSIVEDEEWKNFFHCEPRWLVLFCVCVVGPDILVIKWRIVAFQACWFRSRVRIYHPHTLILFVRCSFTFFSSLKLCECVLIILVWSVFIHSEVQCTVVSVYLIPKSKLFGAM